MAAQVVDFLEPVQVNADECQSRACLARQHNFKIQALVETAPVRQPRQQVTQCHPAQMLE